MGMFPDGAKACPFAEVSPWLYDRYGCSKGRDSLFAAGAAGRSAKTALSSGSGDAWRPS